MAFLLCVVVVAKYSRAFGIYPRIEAPFQLQVSGAVVPTNGLANVVQVKKKNKKKKKKKPPPQARIN